MARIRTTGTEARIKRHMRQAERRAKVATRKAAGGLASATPAPR